MIRDGLQALLERQSDLRVVAACADGNAAVAAASCVLDNGRRTPMSRVKRNGPINPACLTEKAALPPYLVATLQIRSLQWARKR